MSDRVLSTQTAREAIQQMQRIINSGLAEEIESLNKQGRTLSDPNVWDGRLAEQFRSEWPETYNALKKAQEEVERLRAEVQKINEDIMMAGGNM
jgi:uncharacterized protein YukE